MRSTQVTHRQTAPPGSAPARREGGGPPARLAAAPAVRGRDAGQDHPADPRVVDGDVAAAVRAALDRVLTPRLAGARTLDALFARDLAERVADFALSGGRRVRPRLLWWSLRACGGGAAETPAALGVGAALELLQTCALVHDDVMDAAATRRGRPALHTAVAGQYADAVPGAAGRLGDAAAVLAGDLALAWADDLMTDLLLDGADLAPGARGRVRDLWRATRTEMVAGQYLDVQGQATGCREPDRAVRAACLKSARYSVERPLEFGAALAGAGPAVTLPLRRAGRCAGLAFQLRDDLDDLFADPAVTGKPSGGDVREGKPTYLLAVARARAAADRDRGALGVLDASLGRAGLSAAGLDRVRDVVIATGARDVVRGKAERLSRQALRHLAEASLEPGPADALRALLAEVTGTAGQVPQPGGGQPGGEQPNGGQPNASPPFPAALAAGPAPRGAR
ncbi:polyprenyl synthetase family protein [Streptomyces sp. HPF1205]|uniref:polyprenyl synthetase family protein n=1 Tax=Streptomyces sp. HPF1205 TaxID=2873262 RepID=UPI001CEC9539|nr:polyprenyl synthetase family protein [Streptomyces sp. HPF1205]